MWTFKCISLHIFLLAGLKKICKAIAEARNDEERVKAFGPIQEMMTFVQFANDECDYGMGYELGIDLFCYGSHVSWVTATPLQPWSNNLLTVLIIVNLMQQ